VRGWDYDGGPEVTSLSSVNYFAYGTPKWGVNVACGDIDGDGYDEIVTGAGPGAIYGPHVRGWNVDGGTASAMPGVSFLAYGTNKFGVNVSCGDIDGDGMDEIITGAGPGAVFGAHVRGWNYDGAAVTALAGINFFAWPSEEVRYGVKLFAGTDLDDNGRAELVVGPGPDPAAGAFVKVYRYAGSQMTEWLTLDAFPDLTHGATVAAGRF
jgi:fibronectin-binding autotransporter adhesin